MLVPYVCPTCGNEITAEISTTGSTAMCSRCSSTSRVPFSWIKPGMIVGNGYRIDEALEAGNRCKLFLATQEAMDRQVELKVLPPEVARDEEEFLRFQREVKLVATISHTSILSAYGAGTDCGLHFLIRQHKAGEDLEAHCKRLGPLKEKDALETMLPIAEALQYAWEEHQVLHRNLKPENILICEDGSTMLADLAVAKSMSKNTIDITMAGFTVGTPEFMSPEQVHGSGDLDCRSDIYSFSIVLYRVLTGVLPFTAETPLEVMQQQVNEAPVPVIARNPEIGKRCSDFVLQGLEKDRNDRFADWDELIGEMKRLIKGEPATRKRRPGGKKGGSAQIKAARPRADRQLAQSTGIVDPAPKRGMVGIIAFALVVILLIVGAVVALLKGA